MPSSLGHYAVLLSSSLDCNRVIEVTELEKICRKVVKMLREVENQCYENRLSRQGLQFGEERLRGDMIEVCKIIQKQASSPREK